MKLLIIAVSVFWASMALAEYDGPSTNGIMGPIRLWPLASYDGPSTAGEINTNLNTYEGSSTTDTSGMLNVYDGPSTYGTIVMGSTSMGSSQILTLSSGNSTLNSSPFKFPIAGEELVDIPQLTIPQSTILGSVGQSPTLLSITALSVPNQVFYLGVLNSNGLVPNPEIQTLIDNLKTGSGSSIVFVPAVPEPASLILLGLGSFSLLAFCKRFSRS
jgi:PEP-CTERM motif